MPDPIDPDATPDEPVIDPDPTPDVDPDPALGEEDLGDKGKKALDAMKQRVKDAEKAAREAKAEIAKRDAAEALKDKPADEQAIETAKAEGRAEATTAANKRIIRSELKAAAKGELADPTDAALYIDLDEFTVDEDGEVDSDALKDAIADLLARKPHLAAQKQNRFGGDADQGAKGKDAKASQLTEADLDRMSDEEIVTARAEGRLNKILGIKN